LAAVLVLGYDDVVQLLDVDAMLDALEHAFRALSEGATDVPPRIAARAPKGILAAMPGYIPGTLSAKLVSVFPDNHGSNVPSHQGVIVLFDESDGSPLALLDAVHITAVRTAGGSAVATNHLARSDASVLAILGAGAQGQAHLTVLPHVRPFSEIRIASPNHEHAEALAARDSRARAVDSFHKAVEGADVVCCCTDAREPVLQREWLGDGTHVNSVGGSFGPELDPATLRTGRLFVESRAAVTSAPPAGAHDLQSVDVDRVTELGEMLAGTRPGRTNRQEITVYKSVGHAVEDAATVRLVYDRARAAGAGQHVPL
jgi:ornithine cyclodeaminase/alanine dehydrogenase-like protein (mu-crystallin family)